MAPIADSLYFPPLDRCFSGEHQLMLVRNASLLKGIELIKAQVLEDHVRWAFSSE